MADPVRVMTADPMPGDAKSLLELIQELTTDQKTALQSALGIGGGGGIDTGGDDIETHGGQILTDGGDINTGDGDLQLGAGNVNCNQIIAHTIDFAGGALKGDNRAVALSSNAGDIASTSRVTTEELTTAAGASQAFTLTLSGVVAASLAFVQHAGGTNTRNNITFKAVCAANTVTVTVYNNEPSDALNGTLIFFIFVVFAD